MPKGSNVWASTIRDNPLESGRASTKLEEIEEKSDSFDIRKENQSMDKFIEDFEARQEFQSDLLNLESRFQNLVGSINESSQKFNRTVFEANLTLKQTKKANKKWKISKQMNQIMNK